MVTHGVHRGVPQAIRGKLDEIRAHGAITIEELDAVLASLHVERYDDELQQLIIALDRLPIRFESFARSSGEEYLHALPGGGRISRRYLKEIDRYPTMTREDEERAAKRIEFAIARMEAAEFHPQAVYAARRDELQRLRDEFVERNLHIVVSEVYAYRTYNVPLDDLVQEGNAALMHAAEKFDWRHGVRFRTYVAYWIKQAVERHLAAQKGAVRVPHHLQQRLRRLKREGKLPNGIDSGATLDQIAKAFEVNRDQAGHLVESSRPSFSLDQEIGGEGDSFRDLLVQEWEPSDSDRKGVLKNRIRHLLADLDDRERLVLRMRFGLDGRPARTLEQVGHELHLSRERSRQIQQRALSKLRRTATVAHLEDEL